MNWKEEAIEKLCRYDAMKQAVTNIPEEIKRLELEAGSIKMMQSDGVTHSSNRSHENMLLSNIATRHELELLLKIARHWVRTTERGLRVLSPEEKLILSRMFIYPQRQSVNLLCDELCIEQSSVYRKKEKALRKFTFALYGVQEL